MRDGLHDPRSHGNGAMCTLCDWWGTRWALWHDFRFSIGDSQPLPNTIEDPGRQR
jgi:hypothetical protein